MAVYEEKSMPIPTKNTNEMMGKIYKFNNDEYSSQEEYRLALKESDDRYNSYEPWTDEEDEEFDDEEFDEFDDDE